MISLTWSVDIRLIVNLRFRLGGAVANGPPNHHDNHHQAELEVLSHFSNELNWGR